MHSFSEETTTISAQREVELILLNFLKKNKDVYDIWKHHPDHMACEAEEDEEDADDASEYTSSDDKDAIKKKFFRSAHIGYVKRELQHLPSGVQGLYSSRPWLVYWCLQAADFLGITDELYAQVPADSIADFLYACLKANTEVNTLSSYSMAVKINEGEEAYSGECSSTDDERAAHPRDPAPLVGFSGGPLCQIQHLITSYAACCSLCILGDPNYLLNLPRAAIKRWLISLRNDDGSFRVHENGESDIRASYCAAVITTLLRLDDPTTWGSGSSQKGLYDGKNDQSVRDSRVLTTQTALFIASCQTHEGGFSCGTLAGEAHGAYTQCGLAGLLLMKKPHLIQSTRLCRWLANRQLNFEGGFNGRTNKLVDSCYSHWVGASIALLSATESYARLLNLSQRELSEHSALPVHSVPSMGENLNEKDHQPPPPCLRAREMLLLDYVQLVDVKGISCSSETAWEASEKEYQRQQTSLDQFLSANDDALDEGIANQLWKKTIASNFRSGANKAPPRQSVDSTQDEIEPDKGDFLFHQWKLQEYILQCCQSESVGGLMDKPDCAHDAYHTCYALAGLSIAQNLQYITHARSTSPYVLRAFQKGYIPGKTACGRGDKMASGRTREGSYGVVVGDAGSTFAEASVSLLRSSNPIFNMHQSRVLTALGAWGMRSFI